jgi:hypothetical protein
MQTGNAEVKCKGKVVGVATFEVFDSVDEAIDTFGEEAVLELVNTQNSTNARNRIRANSSTSMSKKTLRTEAMRRLTASPELCAQIGGSMEKMEEILQSIEKEIVAENEAAASANGQDSDEEEA